MSKLPVIVMLVCLAYLCQEATGFRMTSPYKSKNIKYLMNVRRPNKFLRIDNCDVNFGKKDKFAQISLDEISVNGKTSYIANKIPITNVQIRSRITNHTLCLVDDKIVSLYFAARERSQQKNCIFRQRQEKPTKLMGSALSPYYRTYYLTFNVDTKRFRRYSLASNNYGGISQPKEDKKESQPFRSIFFDYARSKK